MDARLCEPLRLSIPMTGDGKGGTVLQPWRTTPLPDSVRGFPQAGDGWHPAGVAADIRAGLRRVEDAEQLA